MAAVQNLQIDQGTTWFITVTVTDENGDVKDLTDYTATAHLRKSYYTNTYTDLNATVLVPKTDGVVKLALSSTQSSALKAGRYVYDLEVASTQETLRVIEGIVTVNPEVTR
jgi:hypothetical protein